MPEIDLYYPYDDSSSSDSGGTGLTRAEHPPRRESHRPQISESQQAADEFTTSSSESSLEDYEIRRAAANIPFEVEQRQPQQWQHQDEPIIIDINKLLEINLPVMTDTNLVSARRVGDIISIKNWETSGWDADSERSISPEPLLTSTPGEYYLNTFGELLNKTV